jgi:hypothetical protein
VEGVKVSVVVVHSLPFIDIGMLISCGISGLWQAQHYLHILYNLSGDPICEIPA